MKAYFGEHENNPAAQSFFKRALPVLEARASSPGLDYSDRSLPSWVRRSVTDGVWKLEVTGGGANHPTVRVIRA